MKYIRTKGGIIDISIWEIVGGEYHQLIYKDDIIKQADTIEELCDWFVLRKDGKIYQIYAKEEYAVADLGQYTLAFEWYYAIDTDKGLIYVAKMNDKGELELL